MLAGDAGRARPEQDDFCESSHRVYSDKNVNLRRKKPQQQFLALAGSKPCVRKAVISHSFLRLRNLHQIPAWVNSSVMTVLRTLRACGKNQ